MLHCSAPEQTAKPLLDINLLKTFVEVTKTRNFARAAENLYVTSAAVSARIKLLEGQLGVALFIRSRGNMQLTPEAERLLPLAETMINTWSRTIQEVSLQTEMESRVHIGAPATLWILAMEQRLIKIREAMPEIAIRAEAHSNDTLVNLFDAQTLDLVFLPDPLTTEGTVSEKVGEHVLVLCSTFGSKLKDLEHKPYVYVDWGTAFGGFHARRIGEKLKTTLHANMASIAQSVIDAEGGSAYLPQTMAEQSDTLEVVTDAPRFKRSIYACYRETNLNIKAIREVTKMIKTIQL